MVQNEYKGREGVKKSQNFAYILYGRSLTTNSQFFIGFNGYVCFVSVSISIFFISFPDFQLVMVRFQFPMGRVVAAALHHLSRVKV